MIWIGFSWICWICIESHRFLLNRHDFNIINMMFMGSARCLWNLHDCHAIFKIFIESIRFLESLWFSMNLMMCIESICFSFNHKHNFMESQQQNIQSNLLLWNPLDFNWIIWIFIALQEFARNLKDFNGISLIFMESIRFSWNHYDFHWICKISKRSKRLQCSLQYLFWIILILNESLWF